MDNAKYDYFCEDLNEYRDLIASMASTKAFVKIDEHDLDKNQAWKLIEWAISYSIDLYSSRKPFSYKQMDIDFENRIKSMAEDEK